MSAEELPTTNIGKLPQETELKKMKKVGRTFHLNAKIVSVLECEECGLRCKEGQFDECPRCTANDHADEVMEWHEAEHWADVL